MDAKVDAGCAEVARLIAGSDADWLAPVLVRFSDLVGGEDRTIAEDRRLAKQYGRLADAADLLIKELPKFRRLPDGIAIKYADVAVDALTRLKPLLDLNSRPLGRGGGPRPNNRQMICARVVVEAWRITHPGPMQADIAICEACAAYWRACGGADRGDDVENWRRHIRKAIPGPTAPFREILLEAQSAT
jgi:hypothetical protein